MSRKGAAALAAELLLWQVLLSALWLVLISSVDTLELLTGSLCALLGAVAAVAARRAASRR
ncbi:hypothetical protein [Streptomyces sp. ITFR-6]|uniref:hypothetical protein n=1 Tax=Streptomyces sp. ITFR-6 TaxID=3075197 RepID=UPI00288C38EE|nr:hypothetical protein [Streptomyces sp. ITFR-6]WNI27652.1 hypothetical protein RLT59_01830 [Streptomyces sp. ITFR-6]